MTERIPLPPHLQRTSFSRQDAAEAHLTQGRLRRRDLSRPYHGVQSTARPETALERAATYAVRLKPGQFFSSTTAAVLHGLPVCSASEAWCQMADRLSLDDLVVAADVLLARVDDEQEGRRLLLEVIARCPRVGGALLRRAAGEARRGSASPGETRVRLLLVRAGTPEPELNGRICTGRGTFLGTADLVWRRWRVLLEYEGDGHRVDRDQFRYDIERYERFRDAGWTVVRATGDDLVGARRAALATRVQRLLATAEAAGPR